MEIIARPRQAGKTQELVRRMLESDELIYVAASARQADYVFQACRIDDPAISKSRFIGAGQIEAFYENRAGTNNPTPRFLVDEVDAVLATLLHGIPVAATFTGKIDVSPSIHLDFSPLLKV